MDDELNKQLEDVKIRQYMQYEKEKAQEVKMQQIQQMLMQQIQSQQKKSFMMSSDPRQEAEVALHDLAQSIDAMYEWGMNAKDPLGNFLPDALSSDVKEKYNRLKWLITGMYSNMSIPRNGSLGSAVGR